MRISDWSSDVCSSDLRKPCRVADAGALQDRRRADRTRREHGFDAAFCEQTLAIANEFNTAHARAVHAQAIAECAGHDLQVRPLQCGPQECTRRAPAHTASLRDFEFAGAAVVAGIEVVAARNAGLLGRFGETIENVPAQPQLLEPQLAAAAVMCA